MKFVPLGEEQKSENQDSLYREDEISEKDLVRLYPFGVQLVTDGTRPLLLLKDEKGQAVMPVPLSPIEAGVAITQSSKTNRVSTPHRAAELILNSLHIEIETCVFVEIRSGNQYVVLKLKNHPNLTQLKLRADEAMSLCLHLNVPLFATPTYMAKSKILTAEIEGLAKGLAMNPQVLKSQQKYIQ